MNQQLPTCRILQGDWIDMLKTLPDESVHCCVTSPPYWGLRDYGVPGQLGLEKTPEEYTAKMVEGFREVRRVLREDGTLWLNLGDSYVGGNTLGRNDAGRNFTGGGGNILGSGNPGRQGQHERITDLKPKDLVGIPWRIAFALQADGWYLRSDIIWHKPNPMPESVTDRPTKSHEYIFLLSKSERYFYDAEAIKEASEESSGWARQRARGIDTWQYAPAAGGTGINNHNGIGGTGGTQGTRNRRTVWTIPEDEWLQFLEWKRLHSGDKKDVWTVCSQPYPESHFATFPEDLIKPCILAGTSDKGCCPKCGSPWERLVELGDEINLGHAASRKSQDVIREYRGESSVVSSGMATNKTREKITCGWQSTCDCFGKESVANGTHSRCVLCTVLDPFAGSGTTGQVAVELGRNAILIELNPTYVELIEQRTNVTPGLQLA